MKSNYTVKEIPKQETYEWLLNKHYAKRIPSISFSFGLYADNILVGVCTFGHPASDGLYDICGKDFENNVLELNRLIKNDALEKNVQSFFVSQSIKKLPKPMIIISYSDPNNGHYGYTYQACNFYFTGYGGDSVECFYKNKPIHTRHLKKDEFFKTNKLTFDVNESVLTNFKNNGGIVKKIEQKNRYVYLHSNKKDRKTMLKNFKYKILEYPKGKNKNYDTSYKVKPQLTFF